jgi:ADP-ribosylation factor related protein 1
MYTLLSGLYKQYTQKEEFNSIHLTNTQVIILGLDNAGKTTLLERIKHIFLGAGLDPSRIAPTVGLNIGKVDIGSHRLNFWDLGGQASLKRIWTKY